MIKIKFKTQNPNHRRNRFLRMQYMMAKTVMASSYLLSGSGSNSSLFRQAPALAFFYGSSAINKSLKVLSGSRSYISHLHAESCGYGRSSPFTLELSSPMRLNTSTGATHVNNAGSIDSPLLQSMEKKVPHYSFSIYFQHSLNLWFLFHLWNGKRFN